MERIAILVDVQNVYYTCREKYGAHFDYNYFWEQVCRDRTLVSARSYAIATKDTRQRQFHHILRGIGFDVVLKPFISRTDGSAKGDWDVGIALDAYEIAPTVDRLILVSGDGDFELLVQRIQSRFGIQVDVYGVPGLTAYALTEQCDNYVPIKDNFLLNH